MKSKQIILPYIAALISSVIFGLSFLFSKRALMVASPMELVSFRFLTAFTVMSILILFKVIRVNYKNKPMKWLVLLALIEPVIYFVFETYGIQRTASSVGGLMIALIPIAVTILAAYFLGERPSVKQAVFITVSVSGVALIGIMGNSSGSGTSVLGILLLLGAVLSAGFFNIISRKISKDFSPVEITYFMMFLGAVFFNVILLVDNIVNKRMAVYFEPIKSTTFIISILYLGVLSSIVAYFMINYTLSKIQASRYSVFSNISTIVSIVAGVVFLKESFHSYHMIGSLLIIIGVWGTNRFR